MPQIINYQSRIAVGTTNFNGNGQFKFALVDGGAKPSTQATATANVSGGAVVGFTITNNGSGYSSASSVIIAAPPANFAMTFWSNDGTSVVGLQPSAAVVLPVNSGLYSVLLGNEALANMMAIPEQHFQQLRRAAEGLV